MLLLARHLADVSCFIGLSMPFVICMEIHTEIVQKKKEETFSLLANRCLRSWVRILHSAEEDNLSPFDSNIACLCQSIEINNNKHVYRQSQVRKPTGSMVEWAECLLIIETGCRVQVLAWSSIAQSVCQQAFSLLVNRCLRPWVRILHSAEEDNLIVSFRFEYRLPVPEHRN